MRRWAAAGALAALLACDGERPPPERKLRSLVPGEARLAGFGARACSRGPGVAGAGGPFCAFFRPAPDDEARTELWVIDVGRVIAGEAVPCDGSSAGCLRLTDRLFTGIKFETPSHPEAHRFEGDTLFFLAEPHPEAAELDRYEGLVWAWRPGWRRPRAITSGRGLLCRGSETAPVAYCVDGVSERPRLEFDLRVGRLRDQDDAVLPVVERIAPVRAGTIAWSADFAPGGDLFVYSSWRDGEAAEALRVVPVDDVGARPAQAVLEEGRSWALAPDGRGVYFLRGGREGRGAALWAADFPSGQGAVLLAEGVFQFGPLGRGAGVDQGVVFVTDLRGFEGILHVVRDRRRPESRALLARDAHFWYPSADGRFTYVLQVDRQGERGLVADNDRASSCVLASREGAVAYNPTFLPRIGALVWSEADPADDEGPRVTYLARPEDCGDVRRLGAGIELFVPLPSGAAVYALGRDDGPAAFYYLPRWDGRPIDGAGEPILSQVAGDGVAFLGDEPEALVLGAARGAPEGPGLFVFGPFDTTKRR